MYFKAWMFSSIMNDVAIFQTEPEWNDKDRNKMSCPFMNALGIIVKGRKFNKRRKR